MPGPMLGISEQRETFVREDGTVYTRGEIFVKLFVTFRDNMLSMLKGPKLSCYLCISLHCGESMESWPSLATIEKETGYSHPAVLKALGELEEMGLIERYQQLVDTHHTNTHYIVKGYVSMGAARPLERENLVTDTEGGVGNQVTKVGNVVTKGVGNVVTSKKNHIKKNQEEDLSAATPPTEKVVENEEGIVPPPHGAYFTVLKEVCNLDTRLKGNRGRLNRCGKEYRGAGYDPELIRKRFGRGGWWYTSWWQGKEGRPPVPEDIGKHWLDAEQAEVVISKPQKQMITIRDPFTGETERVEAYL